ncbi:hypothetical protein EDD22DRAFT_959441 [Suillus occidentalis]|nr:hypothetical protein EDD22DRAFT_959441 [Suillus occidentalis]
MSTPVQTSLAGLKASTVKLVGIIAGARHILASTGEAHNVLTKQATTLLGEIVREHEKGDYIPGILASCSKELLRVCSMTPQSAMKSRKHTKSTRLVKLEDEEDTIVQPISRGVLDVVLPQLSTIVVRTPQLPRSPGSPKKQNFGSASTAGSHLEVMKSPISRPEATATSGSRLEVVEPTDDTASASDGEPPAIPTFDIMVPGPNNPCHYCAKEDWHCQTRLDKRTGHPCLSCIWCFLKKIRCQPACVGTPPKHIRAIPAVTTPKVQSRGCSKTTARKTPAPAPATAAVPSSSVIVPLAALDVPMPDLHSMAITIRDGAACIAILEARVREQDGKIDTLLCLHESLWCQMVDWHPSFPLPDSPANATFLLDQSVPPPYMSPLPSALPNLINLDMGVMEPTPLNVTNLDGSLADGSKENHPSQRMSSTSDSAFRQEGVQARYKFHRLDTVRGWIKGSV